MQLFSRASRVCYLGQIERDQDGARELSSRFARCITSRSTTRPGQQIYLSDRTGEIVCDTTRRERMWNWCGAVLHWVYFTELRNAPAVWRQVVLWLRASGSSPC